MWFYCYNVNLFLTLSMLMKEKKLLILNIKIILFKVRSLFNYFFILEEVNREFNGTFKFRVAHFVAI